MAAPEGRAIQGQCFCTAVKFEIAAGVEPAFQAYCHCHSCQCYHSSPFIAVVGFPIKVDHGFADKEGKLKCTEGADLVTSYNHSHHGAPRRMFCKRCGTALANVLDEGIFVTFPRVIAKGGFTFKPQFHGFYGDKLFPFSDGLPKYSGFSKGDRLDEGSPSKEYKLN